MARYVTTVRTPMPPAEAFAYMADLRNFASWDPGVTRVDQVTGDGPGSHAAFDVTVKAFPRALTLRYETRLYEPDTRLVVRADSSTLTSVDEVTVAADGDGSLVTYDAELTLRGLFRVFDLGLGLVFDRIGDRAAAGLRDALDGTEVAP